MNVLVQNIPFGEYYFPLKNEFWKKDLILFSLKKRGLFYVCFYVLAVLLENILGLAC